MADSYINLPLMGSVDAQVGLDPQTLSTVDVRSAFISSVTIGFTGTDNGPSGGTTTVRVGTDLGGTGEESIDLVVAFSVFNNQTFPDLTFPIPEGLALQFRIVENSGGGVGLFGVITISTPGLAVTGILYASVDDVK